MKEVSENEAGVINTYFKPETYEWGYGTGDNDEPSVNRRCCDSHSQTLVNKTSRFKSQQHVLITSHCRNLTTVLITGKNPSFLMPLRDFIKNIFTYI